MKTILIYLQNSYAVGEILNSFPLCWEKELRVCEKNCAVYGQDALLKKKNGQKITMLLLFWSFRYERCFS